MKLNSVNKILIYVYLTFLSTVCFSQDFRTDLNHMIAVKGDYHGNSRRAAVTTDGILIHTNDYVEVFDLNEQKVLYKWDPEGGEGESWISHDAKYIGNYSQNYKDPTLGYTNVFQVLDITSLKTYLYTTPKATWSKPVFSQKNSEVLVSTYKRGQGNNVILFDFVSGRVIKKFFSSNKFSTVVMAMAFSKDEKEIYIAIAENSSNSYFNVYDKETGSLKKKVKLNYQMNAFFVGKKHFFVSGAAGNSGAPFTTKFSRSNFKKIAQWDLRIHNIDPTERYSIRYDYDSKNLLKVNLETGVQEILLNAEHLNQFGDESMISANGRYFVTPVKRTGDFRKFAGSEAVLVFKNNLVPK